MRAHVGQAAGPGRAGPGDGVGAGRSGPTAQHRCLWRLLVGSGPAAGPLRELRAAEWPAAPAAPRRGAAGARPHRRGTAGLPGALWAGSAGPGMPCSGQGMGELRGLGLVVLARCSPAGVPCANSALLLCQLCPLSHGGTRSLTACEQLLNE